MAGETSHPNLDPRVSDALLHRLVTVRFERLGLRQAIDTIAASAGVHAQYMKDIVNAVAHPVTLDAKAMPLGEALDRILVGTRLDLVPVSATSFAVIPASGERTQEGHGIVIGVVRDAATNQPLADAIVVVDSGRPVKTRTNGTFTVADVPDGTHKLLVRLIGYRVSSTPITVHDSGVLSVTVVLTPSATALADVVTTATGDRRRFEVGNAVGTIKADSIVPTTLIRNVSDLLQARIPGLVVSNTDGAVGAPSKIRLRGINSLTLNNDPIIILDGVRLNSQATSGSLQTNVGSPQMLPQLSNPAGGNYIAPLAPSRLDDIDPSTIESIDVLRGPSASSLYGTDAANGVIVIKTKKGQTGAWRTTLSGDAGMSYLPGAMPDMWWGWGEINNATYVDVGCNLAIGGNGTVAGGGCHQDSVTQFNPQNDPAMRTLGTGTNRSLSATLSGGTGGLQQFLSGRVSSLLGMDKMSAAEQRLIARVWSSPAPSWMVHPNTEQDIDGSSRTTFTITPSADVSLSTMGIYRNVLNGGSGIQAIGAGYGASANDTLGYLPSENQRTKVTSASKRGVLSSTANYRPVGWLSFTGSGGGDYGLRTDESNLRAQDCSLALQILSQQVSMCPSGRTISRGETFVATANAGAHVIFAPRPWLTLQTAVGEQYSHTNFYNLQVGNSDATYCPLAFGSTLLSPTPICSIDGFQQYAVNESRDDAATAGIYLEETISLLGIYYTMGVRHDVASAFGGQVNKTPPTYPKFNFSYPLSDQSFFPRQPYISSLRLRLAYGQSGNQASQTAIFNAFSQGQSAYPGGSTSSTSLRVIQLGNPNLRPERGTEWEGGVDVSFLENERLHAEVTFYRKYTRDAIVQLSLAPSFGVENLTQSYNLGNVENRGLEVALTAKLFDTRGVSWDVTINGARNANKLVHKAPGLNANGPLNTQFREAYPLFGYWGVPVESYTDANHDGILEQTEIVFGTQQFLGAPYPKGELSYASSLGLWNGALRVSANLQQVVGQTTQLSITGGGVAPRAAVDRTTPLAQQAAYIQSYLNNRAYLGTSSTVRLNELSVTYAVPPALVRSFHAQSLTVTAAGRNLALWSSYAGKDPNVDTSGLFGDATQDNGFGVPQPRMWTLRFNLGL